MKKLSFENKKVGFEFLKKISTNNVNFDSCFQIFIFEKVNGDIDLNGQKSTIHNTGVLFCAPNQKKKWNLDTKKTKGFHLVFHQSFFSNLLSDPLFAYRLHYFFSVLHPQYVQLSSKDYDFVKLVIHEISLELKSSNNDRMAKLKSLIQILLFKFNKLFAIKHKLSSETQGDQAIYKFKETLERHVRKFHRVDDYCDILQIQRNKLNRIVKTHFGLTVKETIHFRLLQEIKIALLHTEKSIVQIAEDLNLSEPNNMTRFFNRLQGIPPSVFRENNLSNTGSK